MHATIETADIPASIKVTNLDKHGFAVSIGGSVLQRAPLTFYLADSEAELFAERLEAAAEKLRAHRLAGVTAPVEP